MDAKQIWCSLILIRSFNCKCELKAYLLRVNISLNFLYSLNNSCSSHSLIAILGVVDALDL